MEKISIIVPVYNVERYIRDCISCLYQQTYTNFELLIIDDASTDNTLNVIEEYTDSRIRLKRKKLAKFRELFEV